MKRSGKILFETNRLFATYIQNYYLRPVLYHYFELYPVINFTLRESLRKVPAQELQLYPKTFYTMHRQTHSRALG
jgi:hypothetical protein